jgi:hypothetical protein
MSEPVSWHRLFGLSLIDFFRGTPIEVKLEEDLSLKQQLLDVVILRKTATTLTLSLPDGFEELAPHNLITFKSYQEALDGWALNELVGHYVNYRKQSSPTMQELLPETDFRLFAVCVRSPQGLIREGLLNRLRPGVYEARHFTGVIRVTVVHELPQEEPNALLHLFSARMEQVRFGATHYRQRSEETSTMLRGLFLRYQTEAAIMPDALEEFTRQAIDELLRTLPVQKRLQGVSPAQLLAALSPEARAELLQLLKEEEASSKSNGGEQPPNGSKP